LQQATGETRFPGEALHSQDDIIRIRLTEMSNAMQRDYVQCTFARADVWQGWNDNATRDKPLRSLAEVLSFGIFGYRALARRGMAQLKLLLVPKRAAATATVRDRR
jgi:cellulose synthase (UDP-forming)